MARCGTRLDQEEVDRHHGGERAGDRRRNRAAAGEVDQDRAAADQVGGEEEGGGKIERAVALARAAFLLVVVDRPEIAHENLSDGRSPLGLDQC
jgi:hypothetical protein